MVGRQGGWLAEVDKVRPPYNVNTLTQETASFLLEEGMVNKPFNYFLQ
jgi:histidinol-phosphate/aromatic aminotransferase/cobyric acid decarboxylase-like protein